MAGLTEHGLTIKRQLEVLTDLRAEARPIFQDLVPVGDFVDTSDSTTLGRLTALASIPLADLWEAIQEVYLAFDPNSATGIALDNLVQLGGLTRNPASATTATVVIWGDENTLIPVGSSVRAVDNTIYNLSITATLDRTQCIGFKAALASVVVGTLYRLTISTENTSITVSRTATGADTPATVVENLASQLVPYTELAVKTDKNSITVETKNIFSYMNVVPTNLILEKLKTRTEVKNQVVGSKVQEANSINAIATPMLGWDSVNNPADAVVGRDREVDEDLRVRFRESKFLRAQNISDALYSALLEIDGVRYAAIYENETGVFDPIYNLPPHSFKPIVLGGNPIEIATAIWHNKPLGIKSEGNTTATILDSQGYVREIDFERPTNYDVFININIKADANKFPSDGVSQIKSALIAYFQTEFNIGDDVIYSRLYTPINTVEGHQVNSLTIGLSAGSLGTSNIVIPYNGLPALSSNNITITVS